tara:strand:- start:5953 stop:6171 length:219 start_codon:yes stop_codon:yes gene_type:complete
MTNYVFNLNHLELLDKVADAQGVNYLKNLMYNNNSDGIYCYWLSDDDSHLESRRLSKELEKKLIESLTPLNF